MKEINALKLVKVDIERMYRLAYCVNPNIFKPEDVIHFGIDLHRLKECGEVEMKKPLCQIRKHVSLLWQRMDHHQRAAFFTGDLIDGLRKVTAAIKNIEQVLGPLIDVRDNVEEVYHSLFAHMPRGFRERTEKGFGKWKTNGS